MSAIVGEPAERFMFHRYSQHHNLCCVPLHIATLVQYLGWGFQPPDVLQLLWIFMRSFTFRMHSFEEYDIVKQKCLHADWATGVDECHVQYKKKKKKQWFFNHCFKLKEWICVNSAWFVVILWYWTRVDFEYQLSHESDLKSSTGAWCRLPDTLAGLWQGRGEHLFRGDRLRAAGDEQTQREGTGSWPSDSVLLLTCWYIFQGRWKNQT